MLVMKMAGDDDDDSFEGFSFEVFFKDFFNFLVFFHIYFSSKN